MKIVHVYAKNIQMFVDAVEGTDLCLNASVDLDYLLDSLQNFNARDVVGLVLFANPFTRKCVKLIEKFDNFFSFRPMPIILINDQATALYRAGHIKVSNSKLFLIDSEENSIADTELNSIFVTLLTFYDSMYDLSVCAREHVKLQPKNIVEQELRMSDELAEFLSSIK